MGSPRHRRTVLSLMMEPTLNLVPAPERRKDTPRTTEGPIEGHMQVELCTSDLHICLLYITINP